MRQGRAAMSKQVAAYQRNWEALRAAEGEGKLGEVVDNLLTAYEAKIARARTERRAYIDRRFRPYIGGDIHSAEMARAWATAFKNHPTLQGWLYTRSWPWAHLAADAPNLRVRLSVDVDNAEVMHDTHGAAGLPVAVMAETVAKGRELVREVAGNAARAVACPAVTGKLKGTNDACGECKVCWSSNRHVVFAIH